MQEAFRNRFIIFLLSVHVCNNGLIPSAVMQWKNDRVVFQYILPLFC